jgi:hypothetical protein
VNPVEISSCKEVVMFPGTPILLEIVEMVYAKHRSPPKEFQQHHSLVNRPRQATSLSSEGMSPAHLWGSPKKQKAVEIFAPCDRERNI